ncbi:cobalamin-dependent protein, partial [Aduncisulcus paluster]
KEISWDYNQLAKAYMDLLLSHNKAEAIEFVRQLYRQGMAVTDIYAQVFTRTLQETGRLWADGIINICEEHYISEITQTLVSHLSVARLGGPETGKKVVVMNMEGEKHVIAGKMLADFLERSGLETFYLGK